MLLLRGGPVTAEKLVEHAVRQRREFSWSGEPMASVSVDDTVDGWTEERILAERLWSRSTFARASVGQVVGSGFLLLATHDAPHFDSVLPDATAPSAARLLTVFGVAESNPYKRRGR